MDVFESIAAVKKRFNIDDKRIIRGGYFSGPAANTRSASRFPLMANLGFPNVGFRIVCEIPLPKE